MDDFDVDRILHTIMFNVVFNWPFALLNFQYKVNYKEKAKIQVKGCNTLVQNYGLQLCGTSHMDVTPLFQEFRRDYLKRTEWTEKKKYVSFEIEKRSDLFLTTFLSHFRTLLVPRASSITSKL